MMPTAMYEICGGRLKLGGRWYFNGQRISLDDADAQIYVLRGLVRPAAAGVEKLTPQQVGIVTKQEPAPPPVVVPVSPPPPMQVEQPPAEAAQPKPMEQQTKENSNGNHQGKSRKPHR